MNKLIRSISAVTANRLRNDNQLLIPRWRSLGGTIGVSQQHPLIRAYANSQLGKTSNSPSIMWRARRPRKRTFSSKWAVPSLISVYWAITALFSPTDRQAQAKLSPYRVAPLSSPRVSCLAALSICSQRLVRSRIGTCLRAGRVSGAHLAPRAPQPERIISTTRRCSRTKESRRLNSK